MGDPGGGKTFLAAATACEIARKGLTTLDRRSLPLRELPLPIFVTLSRLASETIDGYAHRRAGDVLNPHRQLLHPQIDTHPPLEEWMDHKYQTRDCWLVLDAFDEGDRGKR